ncbi:recombinase family protein [Saccharopolyspora taberi]|uniref:Recombinase family protein n=1 Tax=Saccharopolyspora taberi TaxID=60895 RepID=A0ABN3VKG7_9PSEU
MTSTKVEQRALIAGRISVLTEVTTSPDSQRTRGEAEAARQGMTVVGYAEDPDVSASKNGPWDRPELGAWLREPESFDALIFRSVDRVARDIHDFVALLKWAEDHGKKLVCLDPNIDFSTPLGRAFGVLLAVFAEMEAQAISSRVSGAREYMRRIARWGAGRLPYGYRKCKHPSGQGYALEPDPETAPIVREAVERATDGQSILSICRDFNKRNIPGPQATIRQRRAAETGTEQQRRAPKRQESGKWHPRTLTIILRSDSLRSYVLHEGQPVRGDDGLPLRYGEPLVSDQEFRALQAALDKNQLPERKRRSGTAPLLGVMFCGLCDGRLYRNTSDGARSRGRHVSYRCTSRYRGLADCEGCSVTEVDAEEYVSRKFLELVGDRKMTIAIEDPGEDHQGEIKELEETLSELERDRYEGGLFRGEQGRARYREQYAKIEKRLEALRALPSRSPGVRYEETDITYAEEWNSSDWPARRKILMERGVKVSVLGRPGDGLLLDDRLSFDAPGFTDDVLAAQGHDETNPAAYW